MRLITCGTGSTGNTYLLTNGQETLVIDAGIPFLEVKKALNFNIRSIKGVLVSHSHGDHHKAVPEYEAAGIPVYRPYMAESLRQAYRIGNFTVNSFPVVHNVPCVGYLITHPEIGKLLYATDTEYIRYRFKGLRTVLIEANWSEKYVNKDEPKYFHVLTGHMSIETCVEFIKANASEELRHIILCHLSAGNSYPQEFKEAIREVVDADVTVDVAEKGQTISLDEEPF